MNTLEENLTPAEKRASRRKREREQYERERDNWLNLTPEVRALYMQTAVKHYSGPMPRDWDKAARLNWIVNQAQALAYAAEFPALRI